MRPLKTRVTASETAAPPASRREILKPDRRSVNVGGAERVLSALSGGALALFGWRRSPVAVCMAALGAALFYRGLSGRCHLYGALGIDRPAGLGRRGTLGIKIDKAIVVNESPHVLYAYWRDFRNLPYVVSHLESVNVLGPTRSHWVAKTRASVPVEWDAEIINEQVNELIAWRFTPTSSIQHAGSVRFSAAGEGATLVEVSLQYAPPGGRLGAVLTRLLGSDPGARSRKAFRASRHRWSAARLPRARPGDVRRDERSRGLLGRSPQIGPDPDVPAERSPWVASGLVETHAPPGRRKICVKKYAEPARHTPAPVRVKALCRMLARCPSLCIQPCIAASTG